MRHLRTFDSFWRSAAVGALLALACPLLPLHAQEVYKSVDAEGHVVFSDRGVTKTAPKTSVHVDQPEAAEVARLAKEQELLRAEDMQRQKQEALDAKNKALADQRSRPRVRTRATTIFASRTQVASISATPMAIASTTPTPTPTRCANRPERR